MGLITNTTVYYNAKFCLQKCLQ